MSMTVRATRYPKGYDYSQRPKSYFRDLSLETLIVGSILGEERRKDVLQRLRSGGLDPELHGDWLTDSKLDDATRQVLGAMHPSMMGGEYLPSFGQQEIEIARIVLASTTQDVISIRARRTPKYIAYSVVDEYETRYILSKKRSAQPLTLRELIQFINMTDRDDVSIGDRSGLVLSVLEMNIEGGCVPEELRDFVSVSSSFYPRVGSYFSLITNEYIDGLIQPEDGEEEDAEDEDDDALFDAFPPTKQKWDLQNPPEDPALGAMRASERAFRAKKSG
jgi:hypothetical protein